MTDQQSSQAETADWIACPKGEIQGLARGLRTRRKNLQLQQVTMFGGAMAVLLVAGLWMSSRNAEKTEPDFGGIVCSEVQKNMQAYLSNGLDSVMSDKIKNHLAQCAHCRDKLKMMQGKSVQAMPSQVHHPNSLSFELVQQLRDIDWSNSLTQR